MNLAQEIKKFFRGDVMDDEETLVAYSHDASLFEVRPQVVVFPRDSKDISNLVKWVEEHKKENKFLSITARAAGTCMSGGPLNNSIIMDFTKYMNRVLTVRQATPYNILPKFPGAQYEVAITGEATVQPGCFYRDFEEETLKRDLLLPCYTASKSINAVGGMVGNNSAGELTLRYGKTEDYVKELKVILSDGNEYVVRPLTRRELYTKIAEATVEGQIYKQMFELINEHKMMIDTAKPNVSKNSAGYGVWNVIQKGKIDLPGRQAGAEDMFDLSQVIIGSQGTLGIVTEITWRLVEKPAMSKLTVIFMNDLAPLGSVVKEIVDTNPTSVESYDDKTFSLAMKFFKDFVKAKGLWGTIMFGLSFIPEFWMVLTGGVPKLILLVEYAGKSEAEIQMKSEELLRKISHFNLKTRITASEQEAKKYWDMRRDSFALLRKHVQGRRTAPFIDDIIVRPEFLPEFLPKLDTIFKKYPELVYTIAGHAGNGNFHIIPLMDFNDSKTADIISKLSDEVYDLVLSYQGSIDAEHNDGIIRTPYLEKMFGEEVYALFGKIKKIFDPLNIFNPGKKWGGTKDYMMKHLVPPDKHDVHGS
jgi:FAD/FMN-containing dehydrogenase